MEIVKTHKGWHLQRAGYPVALKFKGHLEPTESIRLKKWLKDNFGSNEMMPSFWLTPTGSYRWATHSVRPKRWNHATTFFIGLRNEADISLILLSIGDQI